MGRYITRRLLLLFPTLIGIITLNFFIVQLAPGGPVDQMIATLTGQDQGGATSRVAGAQSGPQAMEMTDSVQTQYAGAQGLDPELIKAIEKQFGFDKPLHERYFKMLKDYLLLDLGESYYQNRPVLELIKERLPVSISLGLWSLLLVYTISIPMGIAKAVRDGSRFDAWTSGFIFVGYAVPSFLFAVF
ncbi:MAG TPA: microcin ABC transporter permease, partial [Gammaproteobacteria bacterium]|nr:microcin ABC transporter permease [Gammaproteobacteria bacterium]